MGRFLLWPLPVVALLALLFLHPQHAWSWQLCRWASGVKPLFGCGFALETALLALACAAAFGFGGERLRRFLPYGLSFVLVAGQALCLAAAWPNLRAGTGIAWGVDHPAFLYRLHEIRAVFPALGGWNPWWNGGTEHFFSVTSGTHGWALLVSPLLAFLPPHVFEGWAVFAWLFVIFPWLAVLSVRSCGARWGAAFCGGLLQLALSRSGFLYFWQYGIVGGLTTVGLTIPLCALAYRTIVLRRGGWVGAALLGIVAWISCLWSPGLFTCGGLALGALANGRRWTLASFLHMAFAAALALVLLAPWLWTTVVLSRGVVRFVGSPPEADGGHLTVFYLGLRHAFRRLLEWHPAVIALGLAGLPLVPRRLRRLLLPCLLVLGAIVVYFFWNQRSQFDRIAFQTAAVAALPAAILAGRLLAWSPASVGGWLQRVALALAQGVVAASLLLGVHVAAAHAGNAAGTKFWTAEPVVLEFAEWVRDHVPEGGRLAFSGATYNKLDWGTISYLPILSGREMMSADYYSFPKGFVELNYPPKFYRRSTDAFLRFSRAYGITHWAVMDDRTLRFCEEESDHFALVARFQMQSTDMRVFAVTDSWAVGVTRLLEGEGEVEARERHLTVWSADPSAECLVLRYNWRDGLRCLTPGAVIEPFAVDRNLRFIAVRPNGARVVEIGYRSPLRPLAPNFDGTFHH